MEETLRQLRPLAFEAVVVAEETRAYKPDTRPFTRVLDKVGARPEETLHVAGDLRYDIGPAARLGFRTAWVNRCRVAAGDEAGFDHEWDSLWGLTGLVET
jgi:FMN phosphatase YigB (HAD superfamily)